MEKGNHDFGAAGVRLLNTEMLTKFELKRLKRKKKCLRRNLKETVAQPVLCQHPKCGKL